MRTAPLPRRFSLTPRRSSAVWRRLLAVLSVWLLAFTATIMAGEYVERGTFIFFWLAVLFAAWYAGLGAAIVAALAAVIAVNVPMLREQGGAAIGVGEVLTIGTFVVVSTLVSALAARLSNTTTALRESDTQFRTLAESAPVGIVISTPELETIYANPRALEIVGLRAGEFTQERWRALIHPDDVDSVRTGWAPFRDGLIDQATNEFRIRLDESTMRWVRVVSRWVRGPRAERVGVVMTLDDMTRERMLEQRLQQSQKMEAVGQLAGGIAHDFNNLLTVISGNLEFLKDELEPGHPAHQDIAHISAAAERARALVRQLLAFGRKQMLQPRDVDVTESLRQAERWFARVLGDEIECRVHVADDGPLVVHIDPTGLDQVLLNLAVNARDAMLTSGHGSGGQGGRLQFDADRITLDAASASSWTPLGPGEYVRIRARDTGHGMDAATLSHVFEPFFTTKPVGAGTGLGLATVEGIVAQSGGAIRVDSEPGKGTTFTMLFPAVQRSADAGDSPSESAPRPRTEGLILVVEDERAVRRTTRRMLVRAGYTVLEASNGLEAVNRYGDRAGELTAVVSDMRMPSMGGAELARVLRLRAPNLPFVFVSGFAEERDELTDGLDVLLEKPFSREKLLEAIERTREGVP